MSLLGGWPWTLRFFWRTLKNGHSPSTSKSPSLVPHSTPGPGDGLGGAFETGNKACVSSLQKFASVSYLQRTPDFRSSWSSLPLVFALWTLSPRRSVTGGGVQWGSVRPPTHSAQSSRSRSCSDLAVSYHPGLALHPAAGTTTLLSFFLLIALCTTYFQ